MKQCVRCSQEFKPLRSQKYCRQQRARQCSTCFLQFDYICDARESKTCSRKCASALARKLNGVKNKRDCLECGSTFAAKNSTATYCNKLVQIECFNCKKPFTVKCNAKHNILCSKACFTYYSSAPLLSTHSLWNELHPSLNEAIKIDQLRVNSALKVWWTKEDCGHTWSTYVKNRLPPYNGQCPFCSNRRILAGFNDLATTRPDLLKDWDYEKNALGPSEVAAQSNSHYWWKCDTHGSYSKTPQKKFRGDGCSACTSRRLLSGFNDFATKFPELATTWDFEKNDALPSEVFPKTDRMYWWICPEKHSYRMSPNKRCSGRGCGECSGSQMERSFASFVKALNFDTELVQNSRKILDGRELDLYFPNLGKAIEFNGEHWHSEKVIQQRASQSALDYHRQKIRDCEELGIELVFVWEDDWILNREKVEQAVIEFLKIGSVRKILQRMKSMRDAST